MRTFIFLGLGRTKDVSLNKVAVTRDKVGGGRERGWKLILAS